MFFSAANHMVMVARLPGEWEVMLAGELGHTDFIPADDSCQVL